jgi:glycosyltransferase involved in cell wall biosynthesis
MKVLWITNVLFPEVCDKLNINPTVIGGWQYSFANYLVNNSPTLELIVAVPYEKETIQYFKLDKISYILIPSSYFKINNKESSLKCKQLFSEINAEVYHFQGTEYPFALFVLKLVDTSKIVISIQGLVSNYSKYYFGGISVFDILFYITLRDLIRWDTLIHQKVNMSKRGKSEVEIFKSVQHIIGRTHYDRAITWAINPKVKYHFLNETLRDSFYNKNWSYENCLPYSIFISQSYYPIKGLHQFLKALEIIVKIYPETVVYIAGFNFFEKSFFRINGYGHYIKSQIKKMGLNKHIQFLGLLDEVSMVKEFLKSNIVINPSIIENSSNSICEAQLLGVPCIASNVGGSSDLIENGYSGFLYRFEEYEILAKYISDIFSDIELARKISNNARVTAFQRHDRLKIVKECNKIYAEIYCSNS